MAQTKVTHNIENTQIALDAAEIPNLDAAKITSGTLNEARYTKFDDNKVVNDISTLAIRQASNENKAAYNTNSMYVDVFQDSTGITSLTNVSRTDDEYVASVYTSTGEFSNDSNTILLQHFNGDYTDSSSNKRLHPKATCPKCNYSVVLSLKSIQIGPPICPKDNILMVKQGRW